MALHLDVVSGVLNYTNSQLTTNSSGENNPDLWHWLISVMEISLLWPISRHPCEAPENKVEKSYIAHCLETVHGLET